MKLTRKKIIVLTAIILLCLCLLSYFYSHKNKNHKPTIPPIPVKVATPTQKMLSENLKSTGYIEAKENTNITPLAAGYIRQINFHEGESVQQGTLLFQLDSATQRDAYNSAKAAAAISERVYLRDKMLLKKGFITQDLYFSAKETYQQNEATLQTAMTNLNDRSIKAPFTGTLGAINTSLGDYVTPGTTLTTLVDNAHLRAIYTLPATALNEIKLNAPVTILASTGKATLKTTVSYVAPALDQSSQTLSVHAAFNNTNNLFKPGEYIAVTQYLGTQKNALLIPEQSLLAAIDGYSVFILKNNHAITTPVKIGARDNGMVVIRKGLTPNDQVIIAGQNEVKNNQLVTLVTA